MKTLLPTMLTCTAMMMTAAACSDSKSTPTPVAAQSATAEPATAAPCPTAPPVTSIPSIATPAASMPALMTGARTETSACEDRIIFEFAALPLPGWNALYVPAATGCGSGAPITTQGAEQIAISFTPADAHDSAGNTTITNRDLLPGYPSLKEAVISCDFEAETAWVLGTSQPAFTVTAQPNASPPTITVTLAH